MISNKVVIVVLPGLLVVPLQVVDLHLVPQEPSQATEPFHELEPFR